MGGKTLRNSVLALLACVSMIALGWAAAQIAGPPAPTTTAQKPNAPSLGFLARLFGGKRFDLSGLAAWKGKSPHETINGQTLFEHPGFVAALKATLGEERYQAFEREAKPGSMFHNYSVSQDGRILRLYVTSALSDTPFAVVLFINPDEGFIDVFWGGAVSGKGEFAAMLLHTGERFPVKTTRKLSDLKYDHLASPEKYAALLESQQSVFLGTWSGTHYKQNGRAKIHVKRTIAITGNPTKLDGLKYKQEEDQTADNALFSCNNLPRLVQTFEGTVDVTDGVASFHPTSITDPNCGEPPIFMYRHNNDALVRESGNNYGIFQFSMSEPLERVK